MYQVICINNLTCTLLNKLLIIQSIDFSPICQSYPSNIINVITKSESQLDVILENGNIIVFDIPRCANCLKGFNEYNGKCQLSCYHFLCDECISEICPICKKSCTHIHVDINSKSIQEREKECVQCFYKTLKSTPTMLYKSDVYTQCIKTFQTQLEINSVAITPNSKWLIGGTDNVLLIWNIETEKCIKILQGHTERISSIVITPDSKWIITGSWDNSIRVWNLHTLKYVKTLIGHTMGVESVVVTTDSKWIISGSFDRTIRIWDLESGECIKTLYGHCQPINSMVISADSKWLLSGTSTYNSIYMWNLYSKELVKIINEYKITTTFIITPNTKWIIVTYYNIVKVFDIETGKCIKILQGHTMDINSLSITSNSKWIISGSLDESIRIWNLETGECVKILYSPVTSIVISTDSKWIVTGNWDGTMRIYDISDIK
jgi:WD40 repeat protein